MAWTPHGPESHSSSPCATLPLPSCASWFMRSTCSVTKISWLRPHSPFTASRQVHTTTIMCSLKWPKISAIIIKAFLFVSVSLYDTRLPLSTSEEQLQWGSGVGFSVSPHGHHQRPGELLFCPQPFLNMLHDVTTGAKKQVRENFSSPSCGITLFVVLAYIPDM